MGVSCTGSRCHQGKQLVVGVDHSPAEPELLLRSFGFRKLTSMMITLPTMAELIWFVQVAHTHPFGGAVRVAVLALGVGARWVWKRG